MADGEKKDIRYKTTFDFDCLLSSYYVCLKTDLTQCIHQARDNRAELEALQELLMSREKENQVLTSRLAEAQDAVSQLKQLVENHVASEREKNKRVRNNPVDNVGIPHLLEQYSV